MTSTALPVTVFVVVGTRPEAIKMAPVLWGLERHESLRPVLVSTGQHADLLESALRPLDLVPDIRLDVLNPGQSLNALLSRVIDEMGRLLDDNVPSAMLIQGDTTTSLGAALAAFQKKIPMGHVEAGLRTYDLEHPFPEEANRQLVDRISTWCFAPTETARENLLSEGIADGAIDVTGNTGIDTLLRTLDRLRIRPGCEEDIVLITLHRRESFGGPLHEVLSGVEDFLRDRPEARVIWPVHPNPQVQAVARQLRDRGVPVAFQAPEDYGEFAALLAKSRVILTDSGGIQEEGPALGKKVLVARETTERPEGLQVGNVLVGRSRGTVYRALVEAWDAPPRAVEWPVASPFGDGNAGSRIAGIVARALVQGSDVQPLGAVQGADDLS